MKKEEIRKLVDEGFTLDRQIKELSKRYDEIKEALALEARGNVAEFGGSDCKAVVNFASRLDSRVAVEAMPKVRKLAGEYFEKLFCWSPIEKFRDVAKALLGPEKGEEMVKELSGAPGPRVSFRAV